MGWREKMGVLEPNTPIQKVQNIQKSPDQTPFVPIVPFVDRESKIKTDPAPPPDLSRIRQDHVREYITLWYQAHKLADFVDGGEQAGPYAERIKKLPELNRMVERMRHLENQIT